ncbi:MAG: DNA polymerase III subunit epsilon [Proteobacteria bacterium]|nr:DNA polymerase III subunit epsilon [Pseudomonadota bacterium]
MHEIVLDTETTGFDAQGGDRIVELGCIEIHNGVPTGRVYQQYVNPGRDMPDEAFRVHGLSTEFLAGHPPFADVADALMAFLGDSRLVIHNAAFDLGFLNAELARLNRPPLMPGRAIDTVQIARRRFPGAPASLDALCRRFGIDNSGRQLHGALKDADLLAQVYLELTGGRQPGLELRTAAVANTALVAARAARAPRPHVATLEEVATHAAFVVRLKDAMWLTRPGFGETAPEDAPAVGVRKTADALA